MIGVASAASVAMEDPLGGNWWCKRRRGSERLNTLLYCAWSCLVTGEERGEVKAE